MSGAIPPLS